MAERQRASIFEDNEPVAPSPDFDISGFTPKKPVRAEPPPTEAVRAVAEKANFVSREAAPQAIPRFAGRRRRTGRNQQFNVKLNQATIDTIYRITDQQRWSCLGETLERAINALELELAAEKQPRSE